MKLIRAVMSLLTSFSMMIAAAQEQPKQVQRAGVLKLEISQFLYPTSFVMAYERIVKANQTFGITMGYEQFPPILDVNSTIRVRQDLNKNGFKAGADYRFYLKTENRFQAPHGTFIGPYVAYHNFHNNREISVKTSGVEEFAELETVFQIINLGIEMGHQFVINDRWTIDVVTLGPAIANYKASLKLEGDFTFDKGEVESEILLKLLDRFPMLEDLLTDKEVSSSGKFDRWGAGWRFQLSVGYHFGRRKI